MTIERIPHSGALVVSEIIGGYLVTRKYYGYSKREAMRAFRAEARQIKRGQAC